MTDLRTAAQQALEALEGGADSWQLVGPAIDALKAALAEPPVDDPHRDHWVAIAEAAQKIAASTECGLAEAKALCTALDRLTEAALAEPVQEPDSPARRCGGPGCDMRCCQPVEEPQGCDHCNHPLYAAIKCRVCGRVTEQAEPVHLTGLSIRAQSTIGRWLNEDMDRAVANGANSISMPDELVEIAAWLHAQAEPVEPYCHVYEYDGVFGLHREFYPLSYNGIKPSRTMPVYTAPPQRKPLTEEEIFKIENDIPDDVIGDRAWTICFARAIERVHGIGGQP